jgi:hypothetical protein
VTDPIHDAIWATAAAIAECHHADDCEVYDGDYPCSCPAGQIGFLLRAQIPGSPEALRHAKEQERDRENEPPALGRRDDGPVRRF